MSESHPSPAGSGPLPPAPAAWSVLGEGLPQPPFTSLSPCSVRSAPALGGGGEHVRSPARGGQADGCAWKELQQRLHRHAPRPLPTAGRYRCALDHRPPEPTPDTSYFLVIAPLCPFELWFLKYEVPELQKLQK